MRLSIGLEQRQVQKQILAPRMIQSMEILQLPLQALEERIEQEMNENPLLELREADPNLPEEKEEREDPDAPSSEEKEMVLDEKSNTDDFERLEQLDRDVPDYFDERPSRSGASLAEEGDRKLDAMANVVDRSVTLQQHLILQLCELDVAPEVRRLAERIISGLDSNGYLPASLEDLLPPGASAEQLALAEEALAVVQLLEPSGVGARDLRECLLLQLRPETPFRDELQRLITNHLEDMGENRMPLVQRKTGYTLERIQQAWEQLRHLNPKPGAAFSQSLVPTVTPDVFVEQDDDGTYKVMMDDGQTPQLRISRYYRQRLASPDATAEEKEFIKRKINAAQWLIDAINQRRSTLTRVAQAIVDYQIRFLDDGPEFIEPLKMQQIAEQVGVHVTTVSRAVDDKWIQTPRGIYPLRRFFVGGTTSADGEEVAWDAIRIKLQEIVDHEDKTKPYSDEDLVVQLAEHGLTVARRTVTKYRKKMDIPSSRQRRDWSLTNGEAVASGRRRAAGVSRLWEATLSRLSFHLSALFHQTSLESHSVNASKLPTGHDGMQHRCVDGDAARRRCLTKRQGCPADTGHPTALRASVGPARRPRADSFSLRRVLAASVPVPRRRARRAVADADGASARRGRAQPSQFHLGHASRRRRRGLLGGPRRRQNRLSTSHSRRLSRQRRVGCNSSSL